MKTREIRYDELKVNDVILFHSAKVRIVDVKQYLPTDATEDIVVRFTIAPYDEQAVKVLGSFYANGTYGGNADLKAILIER